MTYHAIVRESVPETCYDIDMLVDRLRTVVRDATKREGAEPSKELCAAALEDLANVAEEAEIARGLLNSIRDANRKLRDGWVEALKRVAQLEQEIRTKEQTMANFGNTPGNPKTCVVCNADTSRDRGRCTNGCCGACCGACCTPGGVTTNGHVLTAVAIADRRAALVKA